MLCEMYLFRCIGENIESEILNRAMQVARNGCKSMVVAIGRWEQSDSIGRRKYVVTYQIVTSCQ